MCGVAGIFSFNNSILKEDLVKFTDSLYHRGPDGSGYNLFLNDTVGLGHRRLSILDLSAAANQPMVSHNNRYWIVYNGEVFNFEEIKTELKKNGTVFNTSTDTEVVLEAYIQYGPECLNMFNGMWAIAIFDTLKNELFISRDRFGIKPLYYANETNNRFVFASETQAFNHLSNFKKTINQKHLQLQQLDVYALEGRGITLYNDIYSLRAGHYAIITPNCKEIKQVQWYDITKNIKINNNSLEQNAEKFYALFKDACKLRLISDVPVATALSGGLDSSSVYSTITSLLNHDSLNRVNKNSNQAFVATFAGLESDETEYAKSVIEYLNGTGNFIEHTHVDIAKFEYQTKLYDCITSTPLYSISAVYEGMKKQGISVSLDGHGVDEMLYGYKDMVYNLYNYYIKSGQSGKAKAISRVLINLYHPDQIPELSVRIQNQLQMSDNPIYSLMFNLKNKANYFLKPHIMHKESYIWREVEDSPESHLDFSSYPIPQRMVFHEFFQRTLPSLLRNFDFAGMVNSVEIRMPFMDYRLVEFIYSLPLHHKIGKGFTKLILREAMQNKLPHDVRARTFKVGISSPWEYWRNGVLKEWTNDMLHSKKCKEAKEMLSPHASEWKIINLALIK